MTEVLEVGGESIINPDDPEENADGEDDATVTKAASSAVSSVANTAPKLNSSYTEYRCPVQKQYRKKLHAKRS